ncbi:MAG TPA: hypothetical protein VL996_07885 [Methylocella sp.]|nr:hypothetical protein [Methylocella sp.]
MRGEIWDRPKGQYLAYISDKDELISTKTGATIGFCKDGTLYDTDKNVIGVLTPISSTQSSVRRGLQSLKKLAGWT